VRLTTRMSSRQYGFLKTMQTGLKHDLGNLNMTTLRSALLNRWVASDHKGGIVLTTHGVKALHEFEDASIPLRLEYGEVTTSVNHLLSASLKRKLKAA